METTIRFDRLKKLANHLIEGKLGHERFYFNVYNSPGHGKFKRNGCGTAGCAIGECPIIFTEWCFSKYNREPKLRSLRRSKHEWDAMDIEEISGEKFFGLNRSQYSHLFLPYSSAAIYGGVSLNSNATSKMVGNNILAFIKKINSN